MKLENILITGSSGFIGSHLTRSFQETATVYLAQRAGSESGNWRNTYSQNIRFIDLDSLRKGILHKTQEGEDIPRFDCVYHLASPSTLLHAQDENNLVNGGIALTLNMISFCGQNKAKKLVIAGSSHEYGEYGSKKLTETLPLKPNEMYGAMKAATTTLSLVYAREWNVNLQMVRFFTVYGPADKPNNVIPSMIEASYTGVPLDLTPGDQIRDFVYIDDIIEGLHQIKDCSSPAGSIYNFGSGIGVSLKEIANILIQKQGVSPSLFRFDVKPYRDYETMYTVSDSRKAKQKLQWTAKTTIEDGLDQTYRWYLRHYREVFHEE